MTAQILNFWDYKRPEQRQAAEVRLEQKHYAEAATLWNNDAGSIGIPKNWNDYDPRKGA